MTNTAPAPQWVPVRLVADGAIGSCRWLDTSGVRFTDPFFESTMSRCRQNGLGQRTSPLSELHAAATAAPAVEPTAFIFHVSRCGSTLFSQLLALDPAVVVLSEAPPLDDALRSPPESRAELFADTLRVLGSRRFGDEQRLFVKTDSWHMFHAGLLRASYPSVPFILLYRAPEPVLRSHRRARGTHMVPGLIDPDLMGLPPFDPARCSLDQHAANVLERYYQVFLDVSAGDPRSLLVSYDEGFPAAFLRAGRACGLAFSDDDLARIADRCRYHAKRPQDTFLGEPDAGLDDVDLTRARALYERLEAARSR